MIKQGVRKEQNKVYYEKIHYDNLDFIYQSINYGPFKIIEDLGMINKVHKFKIQFIETGYVSEVAYNQIKFACVRDDMRYPINDNVIYNDKVYPNKYGDFIILKDIPKKTKYEEKNHHVLIRFIDTGTELEALLDDVFLGNVKDPLYTGFKVGDIVESKQFGNAKITKIIGYKNNSTKSKYVEVEFLNSGNTKIVRADKLLNGSFGDYPDIPYNVRTDGGIIGNINSGDYKLLYKRWSGMRDRCLLPTDSHYLNYGAKGVTVDPYWDVFENFVKSAVNLPGYDKFCRFPHKYHLDKDFKQLALPLNKRMYSPLTCVWLLNEDNTGLPRKVLLITSNGGNIRILDNGDFYAEIYVCGKFMEYGTYYSITEASNRVSLYLNNILASSSVKERKQMIRIVK